MIKNLMGNKKSRIGLIAFVVVILAVAVSLMIYKGANGIYSLEKYIDNMADVMSPTREDIQYVEEAYAKLNSFEKKLVSNYKTYVKINDLYIQELIDSFGGTEDYVNMYELVMRRMSKHINIPEIIIDKENRAVVIDLVAGYETENLLANDPESADEYLQVVMDDLIDVTAAGCEITSMYGMKMQGVVTTDENNGMKVMEVENGIVTSYILEAN